jgi:AraC-like DNA-binding protein
MKEENTSYLTSDKPISIQSKMDISEDPAIPPETPPFTLHYFAPDDDLTDYISTLYVAQINNHEFDEYERADRPQLRFMSHPNGEYIFGNGAHFPAPRAAIIGPTSSTVRAVQNSPTLIVGMGLMPAGWAALMGDEANKLTDKAADAATIFGPWTLQIATAIDEASDDRTRITLAQDMVRAILTHAARPPMWFIRTVDTWLTSAPSPKIADLVAQANMSLRSIERMCKIYYGLSPRMLARKYRAVRAASLLARGESLESSCMADAFYDQSHLIRELKHFAGATPRQLRKPSAYTAAATSGRNSLQGSVPPIVSDT